MEKKDIKIKVASGELDHLDPSTKELVLTLKRHFSGIIHAIVRWSLTTKKNSKQQ